MAVLKIITKNAENSPYIEKYKDDEAIPTLIYYVKDYSKTQGCIGGWGIDVAHPIQQMTLLQKLYRKDTGVRLHHAVVSFTRENIETLLRHTKRDLPVALFVYALRLTRYYGQRFQVFFGVHWYQEEHPHIHIIINSVSYIDGKKFSEHHDDYREFIQYARFVSAQYGIELIPRYDKAATKYWH